MGERPKRNPKPKTWYGGQEYDELQIVARVLKMSEREHKLQQQLAQQQGNTKPQAPQPSQAPPALKKKCLTQRRRNQSADPTATVIWDQYRRLIKKYLRDISRESHYARVYSTQRSDVPGGHAVSSDKIVMSEEHAKCLRRIHHAKNCILDTFRSMSVRNIDDRQWAELAAAPDGDGLVDIEHVFCSRCGQEDEENNDILFCDRAGCCRAYHQYCLDPPILIDAVNNDTNEDWSCWQCECIDDCLEELNELFETDVKDWRQLFPELQQSNGGQLGSNNGIEAVNEDDDYDEEADEDYSSDVSDESSDDESGEASVSKVTEEYTQPVPSDPMTMDENTEADNIPNIGDKTNDNNENNSGEDDGDDIDNSSSDESSLADIEDEEFSALIAEAGEHTSIPAVEVTGGYRLRMRTKSAKETVWEPSGIVDVGRKVAVSNRGYLKFGEITAFSVMENDNSSSSGDLYFKIEDDSTVAAPSEEVGTESTLAADGRWEVRFEDGSIATMVLETVRSACQSFIEYEQQKVYQQRQQQAAQHSKLPTNIATEGIKQENIVMSKRVRAEVDYVHLSLALFGSLHDDEDDVEDGEYRQSSYEQLEASSPRYFSTEESDGLGRSSSKKPRGSGRSPASARKTQSARKRDQSDDDDYTFDDNDNDESESYWLDYEIDESTYAPKGQRRKLKNGNRSKGLRQAQGRSKGQGKMGRDIVSQSQSTSGSRRSHSSETSASITLRHVLLGATVIHVNLETEEVAVSQS